MAAKTAFLLAGYQLRVSADWAHRGSNLGPTDKGSLIRAPLSQLQLMRFKGESWERFGDVISSDVGG